MFTYIALQQVKYTLLPLRSKEVGRDSVVFWRYCSCWTITLIRGGLSIVRSLCMTLHIPSLSDTIITMLLVISWKRFFIFTIINCHAQILVHCNPMNEENSTHDKSHGDWPELSDILEINHFDPHWQDEIQSGNKEVENAQIGDSNLQAGQGSKKKPKQRKRRNTLINREKQKVYRQNFTNSLKSDPLKNMKYPKSRSIQRRKREAKELSNLTESEKADFLLRKKQVKQQYRMSDKKRYGGFSSLKYKRLHDIRMRRAEGKATAEDLKYLHDHQEERKLARKKERAARKQKIKKD